MTKKELIEALEPYDDDTEIFGTVDTDEVHNKSHVFDSMTISKGTVQLDMLEEKQSVYLILSD